MRVQFVGLLGLIALPAAMSAQTHEVDQGVFIIGGRAGISSVGGDGFSERVTTFSLAPSLQYFVAPHIAVGGTVSFAHTAGSNSLPSITRYGAGPTISYYLFAEEQSVHPFLSFTTTLSQTSFGTFTQGPPIPDETFVMFRPAVGAAIMVARNVSIIGQAFYQVDNRDRDGAQPSVDTNAVGVDVGIRVFVY